MFIMNEKEIKDWMDYKRTKILQEERFKKCYFNLIKTEDSP